MQQTQLLYIIINRERQVTNGGNAFQTNMVSGLLKVAIISLDLILIRVGC